MCSFISFLVRPNKAIPVSLVQWSFFVRLIFWFLCFEMRSYLNCRMVNTQGKWAGQVRIGKTGWVGQGTVCQCTVGRGSKSDWYVPREGP